MSNRCDYTEELPTIGVEVQCDREPERRLTVQTAWGQDVMKLCDGHAVRATTDLHPPFEVVANEPIAPDSISAERGR